MLAWASGRPGSSDGTWIRALSAEVDELDTGLDRLAWALGVLPLVLAERGAALGRRWRLRLLWLASAGGLGGPRVYGLAVVAGIGMFGWSYANRRVDLPIPAIAPLVFAPFYVLRGFLAARRFPVAPRRSVDVATAVGAVTAVLGFAVVTVWAVVYIGVAESWGKAVLWLFLSLIWVLFVASVGAMCGAIGGGLAHPVASIRSLRTAAVRSLRGR